MKAATNSFFENSKITKILNQTLGLFKMDIGGNSST